MKILIGCEYSGVVRRAFRERGYEAWSCDILPSDDHSPHHIQGDILDILADGWDMMICHPPCQYLSYAGNRWLKRPGRAEQMQAGFEFFMKMINAPIPRIAVENTRGYTWKWYRKPDQIVHPYYFGDPMTKATCFWLKNLPPLRTTNTVAVEYVNWTKYNGSHNGHARSKTFPGIANAIAEQWGGGVYPIQLELWAAMTAAKTVRQRRAG